VADRAPNRERLAFACVLAVLTPLGFATKLYAGPGASWVSHHAGGFLYVLFWVFVWLCLAPRSSPRTAAACVFAITSALELLQLWHPPWLDAIRATFLGHALLGSTFEATDFVYYGLAALAAPPLARRARRGSARGRPPQPPPSAASRSSV
jgi:hypothetical protein